MSTHVNIPPGVLALGRRGQPVPTGESGGRRYFLGMFEFHEESGLSQRRLDMRFLGECRVETGLGQQASRELVVRRAPANLREKVGMGAAAPLGGRRF